MIALNTITGDEYFRGLSGEIWTKVIETDDDMEIEIRPGLLGDVVAAAIALQSGKRIRYILGDSNKEVSPVDAESILFDTVNLTILPKN